MNRPHYTSWRGAALALLAAMAWALAPVPGWAQTLMPRSRAPVTVNFVNADIEAVTRAFAAMIDRPILVDPRVRGTITVYSEQPQSVRDAYLSYLSALRGLGFAVVESGGLLKVVPEADAKLQTGTVSVGDAASEKGIRGDQIITQIFSLRYENANNLVAVLRPLISANNTINANVGSNALVITDYAENLQRIAKIIAALDQPAGTEVEIVPLGARRGRRPGAARAAHGRRRPGSGHARRAPGGAGGSATVVADSRSNSLLIRASNPSRLAALRATIARLDRPSSSIGPGGNMWVVHLKNADATRLATVVRAAFGAIGGSSSGGAPGVSAPAAPAAPAGLGARRHARHGQPDGRGTAQHRRLHPGRPGHQFAHHHRPRAAVQAGARADRPARLAPRAGLHREPDRRAGRQRRGRVRLPVAGPVRPERRQVRGGRPAPTSSNPAARASSTSTSAPPRARSTWARA